MSEKSSDMEAAICLSYHITYPCGPGMREIYIHAAKMMIGNFTNPAAIDVLEYNIQQYEKLSKDA